MSITKGQIIEGVVSKITKFGAFIELPGGATGLVHISEVADSYVKDVNDFLKQQDPVKVKVINIDENGKIGLSIRQAVPKPEKPPEKFSRPNKPFKSKAKPFQPKEVTFEDKISRFFKDSSERLAPLNLKNDFKRKRTNNKG
ncbi:S1 RNA binding domain protein [Desulfonispora thiosulfatigenes DSM 11270]|uniref:S1 RNA binding domain protein n=1 Tax=Desulfonispora thiosulfatigenes DSM 11270 TaxID=656914 RepID=A0A1W1V095_DESTI|nr:S1 RNA-binding domain-containing protein [Desulfonispora thiosulfatigenes]SMB86394.1 S1 RNA binding domain protein [Desulfonispora thiosulfatigenes DSM 11270]